MNDSREILFPTGDSLMNRPMKIYMFGGKATLISSSLLLVLTVFGTSFFLSSNKMNRNDKTLTKRVNAILQANSEQEQARNVIEFCTDYKTSVTNKGGRGLRIWFFGKDGRFIERAKKENKPKDVHTILLMDMNHPATFPSFLFHPLGSTVVEALPAGILIEYDGEDGR